MRIGAITVGQSPRPDITADVLPLLGGAELVEMGALDALTEQEVAALRDGLVPEPGDEILVSRLRDGQSITFSERFILPRLQACIDVLQAQGAQLILFFCTGDFPVRFTARVPLLFPKDVLVAAVPALAPGGRVVVVTPSALHVEQCRRSWAACVAHPEVIAASPFGDRAELEAAALAARALPGELVVLDCFAFTAEMKSLFADITGKPVILPRTLMARVVAEYAQG